MEDKEKNESEEKTREKSGKELPDELLDAVAGGKTVVITGDPPLHDLIGGGS